MPGFNKSEIEQSIVARFENIVNQYGARLAVKMDGQQISYSELNTRSNCVRTELRQHRPGHPEPIALLMTQSISMIAAIVGVLKAGHFYVPLDTSESSAHINKLLQEAGICTVLTDDRNFVAAKSAAGEARRIINVDTIDLNQPEVNATDRISPDENAYVFYTSGTTGRVKGVVDCHRNVLHNIMRYTNNLQISYEDKLTLLQDPSFSGSVSSLFGALLNGASVFPFDIRQHGFEALADLLVREDITIYHSVPSLFEGLLLTRKPFPRLRVVRLEGDRCELRHHHLFQQHFSGNCVLANGLGATETGLSHQYCVTPDETIDGATVPVGNPTEDMEALILDDTGKTLPAGQTGEIAIRSQFLAKGYWRNPAMTDTAFEKIAGDPRRQYRTGDLGRINDEGRLEIIGRKDFQLKIRGHRVDLNGIEFYLSNLPGVERCLVRSHVGWLEHARLVAHILFEPSSADPESESWFRKQLSVEFPAYMIPTRFVPLPEIPMDKFGKISRKDLQPPDNSRPIIDSLYIAPHSHTEKTITAIWEEILCLDQVGVNDEFFDLGGDSLLAMMLPRLIADKLGKKISDASLLEARTVRQLGRVLEDDGNSRCLVAIQPRGSKKPFFCVHAHSGRVLEYRDLADSLGDDQPFYGLQPQGIDGTTLPLSSIEEMATSYLKEVRQLQPRGPYQIGGYCFGAVIAFEMARQLKDDGICDTLVILIDPDHPQGSQREQRIVRRAVHLLRSSAIGNIIKRLRSRFAPTLTSLPAENIDPLLQLNSSRANPVLVAVHEKALSRYQPRTYTGNVTMLCVDLEDLNARKSQSAWQSLVDGRLEIVRLPLVTSGDSYRHLFHAPYLPLLSKALKKLLNNIR